MENKIKKHKENLEKLKQDFNLQLQELNKTKNISQFHNYLTEIISKCPDKKDLIKFITYINDEISRNYQIYDEVIIDTLNELISKQNLLLNDLEDYFLQNKPKKENKIIGFIKKITFKDVKFILGSIIIILILIITIIDPTLLDKLFNNVFKFFKFTFSGKI